MDISRGRFVRLGLTWLPIPVMGGSLRGLERNRASHVGPGACFGNFDDLSFRWGSGTEPPWIRLSRAQGTAGGQGTKYG